MAAREMNRKDRKREVPGVVFVNLQKRYVVQSSALTAFGRSLKRALRLEKKEFNVCFVDDSSIRHLNLAYRGKNKSTDVLSFPWNEAAEAATVLSTPPQTTGELKNFLGDIVISVETANRNAEIEGHSRLLEIRWLILHGLLHLLGFDHEKDNGQMVALELRLRDQLKIAGAQKRPKISKPRRKNPKQDQPHS
jgi:probable rRNA maturation factor